MIDVLAVNVGPPRLLGRRPDGPVYSGIAKAPVPAGTALWLSLVNLAGDGQADQSAHGGPDKAVYAYPSEHLPLWSRELDEQLGPAAFGENLSTRGVTEPDVCIGDRWRWDGAVLEVCQPRWPCYKLSLHRGRADIQNRLRAAGRTGWYLRVLTPGEVTVGSPIEVVEHHPARLSVTDAHLAMADRHVEDRERTRALADLEPLAAMWRNILRQRLGL